MNHSDYIQDMPHRERLPIVSTYESKAQQHYVLLAMVYAGNVALAYETDLEEGDDYCPHCGQTPCEFDHPECVGHLDDTPEECEI